MNISRENVLKHVSILQITREFMIGLEKVSSGNFDYRCKCPSKEHKNGMERTNSCYINSCDNNFYCFGCNAGSNVIDFYMLCSEGSFLESISYLRTIVDVSKIEEGLSDVKKRSNFPILVEISGCIREHIQTCSAEDSAWVNKFMMDVDEFVASIDRYDIDRTKKLLRSVRHTLSSRSKKL
jgi:hypothetical protein